MTTLRLLPPILLMALVTYAIRFLPIALLRKRIKSPFLLSFLYYIPYGVLTAMTLPAIFSVTGNPYSALAGLVAAVAVSWKGRNLMLVALAAVLATLAVEILLRFIL